MGSAAAVLRGARKQQQPHEQSRSSPKLPVLVPPGVVNGRKGKAGANGTEPADSKTAGIRLPCAGCNHWQDVPRSCSSFRCVSCAVETQVSPAILLQHTKAHTKECLQKAQRAVQTAWSTQAAVCRRLREDAQRERQDQTPLRESPSARLPREEELETVWRSLARAVTSGEQVEIQFWCDEAVVQGLGLPCEISAALLALRNQERAELVEQERQVRFEAQVAALPKRSSSISSLKVMVSDARLRGEDPAVAEEALERLEREFGFTGARAVGSSSAARRAASSESVRPGSGVSANSGSKAEESAAPSVRRAPSLLPRVRSHDGAANPSYCAAATSAGRRPSSAGPCRSQTGSGLGSEAPDRVREASPHIAAAAAGMGLGSARSSSAKPSRPSTARESRESFRNVRMCEHCGETRKTVNLGGDEPLWLCAACQLSSASRPNPRTASKTPRTHHDWADQARVDSASHGPGTYGGGADPEAGSGLPRSRVSFGSPRPPPFWDTWAQKRATTPEPATRGGLHTPGRGDRSRPPQQSPGCSESPRPPQQSPPRPPQRPPQQSPPKPPQQCPQQTPPRPPMQSPPRYSKECGSEFPSTPRSGPAAPKPPPGPAPSTPFSRAKPGTPRASVFGDAAADAAAAGRRATSVPPRPPLQSPTKPQSSGGPSPQSHGWQPPPTPPPGPNGNHRGKMLRATALACLGLPAEATSEEVRRAYKQAALRCHPDRQHNHGSEEDAKRRFQEVREAFELLQDKSNQPAPPQGRRSYGGG